MTKIWIHTGMPKTGSTAIQYFLSRALPHYARRNWTPTDLALSLSSQDSLMRQLTDDWSASPVVTDWSALVLRSDDTYVISHEEYASETPALLEKGTFTGLVFLRDPAGWAPSAVSQTLLFNYPLSDTVPPLYQEIRDSSDSRDYLRTVLATSCSFYVQILHNVPMWRERSRWFEVAQYGPATNVVDTVSRSLARAGIEARPQGPLPVLRTSSPLHLGLLALEIYRTAVFEFGILPKDALRLTRLALGVEPGLLRTHLTSPSTQAAGEAVGILREAHRQFENTVSDLAQDSVPTPFGEPTFEILDDHFARDLARSLIRASEHLARIPDNFDPEVYLAVNPDVSEHARSLSEPLLFARDHFARHGAFEVRPATYRA